MLLPWRVIPKRTVIRSPPAAQIRERAGQLLLSNMSDVLAVRNSMTQAPNAPLGGPRTTARAFFVADRINTSGLERSDVLATTPLAFRVNDNGVAILFRYGV